MFDLNAEFNEQEEYIDTFDTRDEAESTMEDLKRERGAGWKFWIEET